MALVLRRKSLPRYVFFVLLHFLLTPDCDSFHLSTNILPTSSSTKVPATRRCPGLSLEMMRNYGIRNNHGAMHSTTGSNVVSASRHGNCGLRAAISMTEGGLDEMEALDQMKNAGLSCTTLQDGTKFAGPVWGVRLPVAVNPRRPPLPKLTEAEGYKLLSGQRLQKQTRTGRVGTGMVVVDVEADVSTVMAVLTDLDRYPERIPTVRDIKIHERGKRVAAVGFSLSRFRLEINAEMRLLLDRNMFEFRLDANRPTLALQEAKGFWYVEPAEGRPKGWSRIWLKADVKCSVLLPPVIIDYAASRALPRASAWLSPVMKCIAGKVAQIGSEATTVHSLGCGEVVEQKKAQSDLESPKWVPPKF